MYSHVSFFECLKRSSFAFLVRSALLSHMKLLKHLFAWSDCLKDNALFMHAASQLLNAPGLQTQGVSASGVRGYPANLLLHDKQAQQQASAPQSAHHYYHNLPDSVKYQPQITELGGPQADDLHSLPDFAGNSMGGGVMQKVSPQATSQTANFSRFNILPYPAAVSLLHQCIPLLVHLSSACTAVPVHRCLYARVVVTNSTLCSGRQ